MILSSLCLILKLLENMVIVCCCSMVKIIKTEEEDTEENLAENSHLLPRETPCQEPIKSERLVCLYLLGYGKDESPCPR
jgi:hypothetical protein